jgi:hypothetical protein
LLLEVVVAVQVYHLVPLVVVAVLEGLELALGFL